jgi:hypothetical protein
MRLSNASYHNLMAEGIPESNCKKQTQLSMPSAPIAGLCLHYGLAAGGLCSTDGCHPESANPHGDEPRRTQLLLPSIKNPAIDAIAARHF